MSTHNGVSEKEKRMKSSVVQALLKRNDEQSAAFIADAQLREQYLAQHPTQIIALKCMDGRLNLAYMTGTPLGVINPHRNLGGEFKIGWPYFGSILQRQVEWATKEGKKTIIFTTYHFSKGDPKRGCAGFNYDTDKARASAQGLKKSLEDVFGNHAGVYPIVVGIETDEDSLIIHGEDGSVLDFGKENSMSELDLTSRLTKMFPDMPALMIADLMPLLLGNQAHVQKVKKLGKPPIQLDHKEQVFAFGRGFDWLHEPHWALIVGPYDLDLRKPIRTAAKILWNNLESGRIPKDEGVVLLISSVYRGESGPDKPRAKLKSKELANLAVGIIREEFPQLAEYMTTLIGIVNPETRKFIQLED